MNATTKPTEAELWDAYVRDRSVENRNRLVELHMPLAFLLAGRAAGNIRRKNPLWDMDSLSSEAAIGLVRAVELFDPTRGLKFTTYATPRIRGAIADALRSAMWATRWGIKNGYDPEFRQMPEDLEYEAIDREHEEPFPPDWINEPLTKDLSERSKLILRYYFEDDKSMREIGEIIGLSQSRVSLLMADIIRGLREKGMPCTATA